MSLDPVDRREEVHVTDTGTTQVQQQVVENSAAERYDAVNRLAQFIWVLFGLLEALIAVRVLLRLIGANPASPFARLIYALTDLFLWPFRGLVATPAVGQFVLDIPAVIGMLIYLLLGWLIVRLVWLLLYRPGTRTIQTYRRDRL